MKAVDTGIKSFLPDGYGICIINTVGFNQQES